jgi:hypothetical protein
MGNEQVATGKPTLHGSRKPWRENFKRPQKNAPKTNGDEKLRALCPPHHCSEIGHGLHGLDTTQSVKFVKSVAKKFLGTHEELLALEGSYAKLCVGSFFRFA